MNHCIPCGFLLGKNSSLKQHYMCPNCDFSMESDRKDLTIFVNYL